MSSGACVLELHQKSVTKESWPVLQWGAGDGGVWHAVTNTLHCYGRAEGFKGAARAALAQWTRCLLGAAAACRCSGGGGARLRPHAGSQPEDGKQAD